MQPPSERPLQVSTASNTSGKCGAMVGWREDAGLRGEQVPASIMLPVQIVDASNCAAWVRPYAERARPAWDSVV